MNEVAQKDETTFRIQVDRFLDTLPKTWHESIQQTTERGTPDKLICCNERFVAVEIKTNVGEASPLQAHKLKQITKAGGMSYLLRPKNFSEFRKELLGLSKSKKF